MDPAEFEKRREAQVKAICAMDDVKVIRVIELIELLLLRNPSELVAKPDFLMKNYKLDLAVL